MSYQFLVVKKQGAIAEVKLNRPEKMNALNTGIMTELEAVAKSFLADEQTRVVIFSGEGKHFSAGADLSETSESKPSLLMRRRDAGLGARMIEAILDINQVTICAVQGAALGGGACIPTACDFRVASQDAFCAYPEVNLGINLMWRSLPLCVRLIGPAKAKRMIMSGERIEAEILLDWGFFDVVKEREQMMPAAYQMAELYASQPPIAVQMIKQSINAVSNALDGAVMHMDTDQNVLTQMSQDRTEAIKAYFGKRPGNFKGD